MSDLSKALEEALGIRETKISNLPKELKDLEKKADEVVGRLPQSVKDRGVKVVVKVIEKKAGGLGTIVSAANLIKGLFKRKK